MKKIFTMICALMCVTAGFAQTAAEELDGAIYSGSATVKINVSYLPSGLNVDAEPDPQTVSFETNASDPSKVDMTLSEASATALGYTVTLKEGTVTLPVTKSGSTYALDTNTSFNLILNNGTADATVTAKITSSSITVGNGTATIVMNVTNLPSAMTTLQITSLDFTYSNLSQTAVTGIDGAAGTLKIESIKMIKDGKVVIIKDGKEYNAAGQLSK